MIQVYITYIKKITDINHSITVEVVYILPNKQYLQRITLEKGVTVETVIRKSGLLELNKDIDLKKNKIGIHNQPVRLVDKVNDGDRIEIYRPLIADPRKLRWHSSKIRK